MTGNIDDGSNPGPSILERTRSEDALCSRLDLHECHQRTDVDSLHDAPNEAADLTEEETANACDYFGVLFTLVAVVAVAAFYTYSSTQFHTELHSGLRGRRDSVSIEDLNAQVAALKAKHQEQLAKWEELQERQDALLEHSSGQASGLRAPTCCQDLRKKIEQLVSRLGEFNLDSMARELEEIRAAQSHANVEGTCARPCDMNLDELENVVEAKVRDKCASSGLPSDGSFGAGAALAADYDRTGKPDYALESAGGSIVSTRCTETYSQGYSVSKIFGIPVWWTRPNPREVLNPDMTPGRCWAMAGTKGHLVIRLALPVVVTSVTYEHIPVQISVHGNIDSAPREFAVYALRSEHDSDGALLGQFSYDKSGNPWQTFQLPNIPSRPVEFVELRILSNWGNPDYTCLYRFRVHGDLQRS